MKKPKKPKTEKQEKTTDGESKPKPGLVGKLLLPAVLGITSFCTVYFLPRNETAIHSDDVANAKHQTHDDNNPGAHGQGTGDTISDTSFITLEPFTVSLKGRSRLLRLSITLETPQETANTLDPNNPKLRDAFMGYLSALGMEQIQDAAFLVQLRVQLTRRAKFVLGQDSVHNILITDFMVR
jgi:flagellar basal body-associated protein FliL